MVKVIAKNFGKPQKIEELIRLFAKLASNSHTEAGCLRYELYQDINNPEILTMVEEWDSQEHLDAHLNTAFFKKTAAKLNKMYTKETEMNIYVQVL